MSHSSHSNSVREGPPLDRLLHRLAECPSEFFSAPSELDLLALACDHFRWLGKPIPDPKRRQSFSAIPVESQRLAAVVLWLLRDEWFLLHPDFADASFDFLQSPALSRLASLVRPDAVIQDPDRREELTRLCLKSLQLIPAGESAAEAEDRLATLDSVERERVIRETRRAEARTREIRAAMALKQAQEAAARYSPE